MGIHRYFFILFFLFVLLNGICFAQFSKKIDSLEKVCNTASTDNEKVTAYGQLAELYYVYQFDNIGDSILERQAKLAELSGDKQLILNAYFGDAITNISAWRRKESFDKALSYLEKGRDYAKSLASDEWLALAYARIANLYRKWGQTDNAFNTANAAYTTALTSTNDSVKIITAIELGDAYQAKNDALPAFKLYTKAYEDAVNINNLPLQSEINHRFAELYLGLNNIKTSLDYLLKNEKQNKKNKYTEGLIKDYIDLARVTDEKSYALKAIQLADSLHLDKYTIMAKGVMYGFYTFVVKNADSTFRYINENEDLKLFFSNRGEASNYNTKGNIYLYAGNYDSAIYYFQKALPGLDSAYDAKTMQSVYMNLGICYTQKGDIQKAIVFYLKSYVAANNLKNLPAEASITKSLGELYEKAGEYKKAIDFYRKNAVLKESLTELTNQKDIALAEINNEKRNHENELARIEKQHLTKRNLQYMAITLVISLFFIILFILGMFPINKLTIKLSGFFVFICLFEFIVLLIDSWLHKLAHGEPLKIWLMKIFIIALLVPCQHYLEHQMIKFIESAKLYNLRMKMVNRRNKKRTKMSAVEKFDDMEKDSAVL